MRHWPFICFGLLLAFAAMAGAQELQQLERSLQRAIARAEGAVVCIHVSRRTPVPDDFYRAESTPEFFGSGIAVDARERLILTAYHVVRDATAISVKLPGPRDRDGSEGPPRTSDARIYAADPRSDLAVLQLMNPVAMASLELGKAESLRKGSMVLALAHPFAVGGRDGSASASWGIISNLRRRLPGSPREEERSRVLHHYGTLLQTDAKVQLGSSGGALIDLEGQLVGILTATAALAGSETPGGYAMPMDANLRRIVEVLKRGEEVEYGFLGVAAGRPMRRGDGSSGVQLSFVTVNSPASKAGLNPQDVILSVNGQPIREHDDLFLHIGAALAGQKATLKVLRFGDRGEPQTVEVTLAKFAVAEPPIATHQPPLVHGLRVDYVSVLPRSGDNQAIPDAVLVREVKPRSPAEQAGLIAGASTISEVNGRRVATPREFYAEVERATKANLPLLLRVANPNKMVTLP